MVNYIVIELADGLTAVELPFGQKPEETAEAQGGTLVDEGLFATLEEAEDAIENREAEEEEESNRT